MKSATIRARNRRTGNVVDALSHRETWEQILADTAAWFPPDLYETTIHDTTPPTMRGPDDRAQESIVRPFRIHRTNDGGWYWRLVAANGETLAHSETYTSKAMAEKGIRAAVSVTLDAAGEAATHRLEDASTRDESEALEALAARITYDETT